MTAVVRNLTIEQGATYVMAFQWREYDPLAPEEPGPPHDLTGWTGRMQIRKAQSQPVLLSATTDDGRIIFGENLLATVSGDPTTGWIKIVLSDEDTDALTLKTAKYDLEVEDPQGRVYRLLKGAITVDPNITQEV